MKSIRETARVGLVWRPVGLFSRSYELVTGDEVVARLELRNPFSDTAQAVTAEGRWTLRRDWLLGQSVSARTADSTEDVAWIQRGWLGEGRLELRHGERYALKRLSFWRSHWALTTEGGVALLEYAPRAGFLAQGHELTVTPAGLALPELALLTLLTGYVCTLKSQDTMVAT